MLTKRHLSPSLAISCPPAIVLAISATACSLLAAMPVLAAPEVLAHVEGNWTGWLDFNGNGVEDVATYEPTKDGVRVQVFDFSESTEIPLWSHQVTREEICGECEFGGAGILDFPGWDGLELVYTWVRAGGFDTGYTVFSVPDGSRHRDVEMDNLQFVEKAPSFSYAAISLRHIGDWDAPEGEELVLSWWTGEFSGVALLNLESEEITYSEEGLFFSTVNNDMSGDGLDDAILFDFETGRPDSMVFWGGYAPTPVLVSHVAVTRQANGVLLEWSVPEGSAHQWFEIERRVGGGEASSVATIGPGPDYSYLDRSAVDFADSVYWLVAIDQGGLRLGPFFVEGTSGTDTGYTMSDPTPNPFPSETHWQVDVPSAGPVQVEVVDAAGRVVHKHVYPSLSAGTHVLSWSGQVAVGRPHSSGVYWIRARWHGEERTRKVTRVR